MAVDLGKQYGPLPLGAWVAVVGGGLGIAWYTRQRGGTQTVYTEDGSGTPGVGTGAVSTWIQNTPPADDSVSKPPATNEEWARLAINYLIAQGYDPALSDTAIRKYLESTQLSLSENALVKIALAKLGAPPVPLPAPPDQPTPPPASGGGGGGGTTPPPVTQPPPSQVRWVVVTPWPSKFGTLWGIAQHYYGSGAQYPRIYNANRVGVTRPDGTQGTIRNPNLIYPGQRLWVP